MAYTVAIIGSFQKYYNEILGVIKTFKEAGLYVTSPKESNINGRIGDFVVFESDRKDFNPAEIQMITLDKIMSADAVYVYNPSGYVGRTTCYEIGFCLSRRKAVCFLEYPNDLPIPILGECQVLKPEEFVELVSSDRLGFVTNYNLCPEAQKAFNNLYELDKENKILKAKKIVICGSMQFFDEMLECQKQLEEMGIEAIIPKEEDEIVKSYDEKQFIEFKKRVSRTYLKKIRDKDTAGVLIYNAEKRGIANYIGANTLVELAMAFSWNRKIYLFNDIYDTLKDELQAWDCICLKGKLEKLKEDFVQENTVTTELSYIQYSISDYI